MNNPYLTMNLHLYVTSWQNWFKEINRDEIDEVKYWIKPGNYGTNSLFLGNKFDAIQWKKSDMGFVSFLLFIPIHYSKIKT